VKAIAFIYSWSGRRELDTYFDQVARAFGQLGITLKVVLGNELLHPNGSLRSLHPYVDEDKLLAFVAAEQPDFLFTVNNSGMTSGLEQASRVPIVKWLVDDISHLFFHDGVADAQRLFARASHVICYSTTLLGQLAAAAPEAQDRLSWVPHGSSLAGTLTQPEQPAIPISFVGTCLDHRPFLRVLEAARSRGATRLVLAALEDMRQDYVSAAARPPAADPLVRTIEDAGVDRDHWQRVLADLVTSQNRVQALLKIEDLGLHLFGNDLWLNSLAVTSRLADRFEFERPVNSHERLLHTYARSRISVNIPNVQNCAGLAVRVFDVMASPSLLISEYHPDSDLFRLFGRDCPVPMYKSFDHLRELCTHYLNDEEERSRLVRRSNELVGPQFRIRNRLAAMLTVAGISCPDTPGEADKYEIVDTKRFYGLPRSRKRVSPWLRLAGKRAAKRLASPLFKLGRSSPA
jgi:hypothetical protein